MSVLSKHSPVGQGLLNRSRHPGSQEVPWSPLEGLPAGPPGPSADLHFSQPLWTGLFISASLEVKNWNGEDPKRPTTQGLVLQVVGHPGYWADDQLSFEEGEIYTL